MYQGSLGVHDTVGRNSYMYTQTIPQNASVSRHYVEVILAETNPGDVFVGVTGW